MFAFVECRDYMGIIEHSERTWLGGCIPGFGVDHIQYIYLVVLVSHSCVVFKSVPRIVLGLLCRDTGLLSLAGLQRWW